MTIETEVDAELEVETTDELVVDGEESDELIVTIGDAEPDVEAAAESREAPQWVKDVRKENRELKKKLKQLEAAPTGAAKAAELGAKPKLADFNFDADLFEPALEAWHAKKADAEKAERDAQSARDAEGRAWSERLTGHTKAKGALKVADYDDVEEQVFESLDVTQQGIIIQGSKNSALVIYALGKNPKKLAELAAIKDPVRYAFAIAELELQLKTTKRRPATEPEKTVERGSAGRPTTSSASLEKLRADALRTGDYSKVNAARRAMRAARA